MEQILAVQSKLRLFPAPRIPIEAAFVRICRPVDDTSFAALEARVALLEARPETTLSSLPDGKATTPYTGEVRRSAPHDDPVPPWEEPPMPDEPPMPEAPPEPVYEPQPEPMPDAPQTTPSSLPGGKAAFPYTGEAKRGDPVGTTPVGDVDLDVPPKQTQPAPAASGEAETVWDAAKKKIMELNPMVYFYVKDTRGAALDGDTLTVEFPAPQESSMIGMKNARNLKVAKDAIDAVRPGTELSFRLAVLLDKNEEKLKELFGSSLTIN